MPIFRAKQRKNLPFVAAHTYMAYVREYPPEIYKAVWHIFGLKNTSYNPLTYTVEGPGSSHQRAPSGREKGDRNWSRPPREM